MSMHVSCPLIDESPLGRLIYTLQVMITTQDSDMLCSIIMHYASMNAYMHIIGSEASLQN